jgi:hypothetical protein
MGWGRESRGVGDEESESGGEDACQEGKDKGGGGAGSEGGGYDPAHVVLMYSKIVQLRAGGRRHAAGARRGRPSCPLPAANIHPAQRAGPAQSGRGISAAAAPGATGAWGGWGQLPAGPCRPCTGDGRRRRGE